MRVGTFSGFSPNQCPCGSYHRLVFVWPDEANLYCSTCGRWLAQVPERVAA